MSTDTININLKALFDEISEWKNKYYDAKLKERCIKEKILELGKALDGKDRPKASKLWEEIKRWANEK
jgi:hypothetical protein